jgi:hypothetical protein
MLDPLRNAVASRRRMTRLTNGFSKKLENLSAAAAVNFMDYNFGARASDARARDHPRDGSRSIGPLLDRRRNLPTARIKLTHYCN